jgi:DNA-directed RNA polymerase alpha subunit
MRKEEVVKELVASAEKIGVVTTLYEVFGKKVSMSIPFSNRACETSIDDMDFSVRANNSMKRAGVFKLGDIIDIISSEDLTKIRNLGKKTENEIKTKIMAFGYEQLTTAEKQRFFYDILERNVI